MWFVENTGVSRNIPLLFSGQENKPNRLQASFLPGVFFTPKVGNILYRKVGYLSISYMALYPRKFVYLFNALLRTNRTARNLTL
jgi:hypothetical protein